MKSFKEVEKTARDAYLDTTKNSVNRSSLLVPEIFDTDVEISFVNHFLIKRGLKNVSCVMPILPLYDSILKINNSDLDSIERDGLYRIQTTQIFKNNDLYLKNLNLNDEKIVESEIIRKEKKK